MRYGRLLVVVILMLAAFGAMGAVAIRSGRSKVGPVEAVKPDFDVVLNAMGIGVFAARVAPGSHVIVFDAGMDQEGRPIDALLRALNAGRDDVTDLFLTHAHPDHIAGAHVLTKARVHLGAADVPLAEGKIQPDSLASRAVTKVTANPPFTANAPLTGPATFAVGAADPAKVVKALPVPGHTPGSYAYLYDGILVAGDMLTLSQGRLEPTPRVFDAHPAENKAAILSLKQQLAGETLDIVCTSHGGCTPKGLGKTLLDDLISRLGG
jgi:hydroxyacylglutathione hydrolase